MADFVSEPLSDDHDLTSFESGEPALDDWLRRSAAHAEAMRTARTFAVKSVRIIEGIKEVLA